MAIIDRIKFDGLLNGRDWLIYRYPGDNFVTTSQLIVGEGQVAVFIKGGRALDYFTAGTYTLSTDNIPILTHFINLPYGGKTPFSAELYFINKTSKLDMNWGTTDPIQIIDPKYNIRLRIRAFGQFGIKVNDFRVFLTELIGTLNPLEVVNYNKITSYFRGLLVMKTKSLIAKAIINNKISALDIAASIEDISEYCKNEVSSEFERFGLKIVNFFINSINFPDEDFEQINAILHDKAAFDIIGDNRYVTKRSFDTLETAAGNESGIAGTAMGAGLGIGAGFGIGNQSANIASGINTAPPQKSVSCPTCGAAISAGIKFCPECGAKIEKQTILCPGCNAEIPKGSKFCPECGNKINLIKRCPKCNHEITANSKFCNNCGEKLEG